MKFIGITGGVGAGKTEILQYLAAQEGVKVLLADEVAHTLMEPGGACYEPLLQLFSGEEVLDAQGRIKKDRLAGIIFSDEQKRAALNAIVHPAVRTYVLACAQEEQARGQLRFLFFEAALLIEEGYDKICNELWYVYTTEEKRKERLSKNRGYTAEKTKQIMKSQLPEETYRKYCKVVIDNNGTKADAIRQVAGFLERREYQI